MDIEARMKEIESENAKIVNTINQYTGEIEKMKTVYTANLGRLDELKKFIKEEKSDE
jgi:hypothetical protein